MKMDWNRPMTKLILIKTFKPLNNLLPIKQLVLHYQVRPIFLYFSGKRWLRLAGTNHKPWNLNKSKHAKLNRGDSYVLCALCCQKLYKFSFDSSFTFWWKSLFFQLERKWPCYVLNTRHSILTIENTTVSIAWSEKRVYPWAFLPYFGDLQRLVCQKAPWI